MKRLIYISLLLFFASCRNPQENKKFITADFKYSNYIWHTNPDSYQREFLLADYLHVDSNGYFKLIKHNPDTSYKHSYFGGTISDSVRRIIDSIILGNKYLPEIRTDGLPDTPLILYHGLTYHLDYKLGADNNRKKIQYINSSSRTPENILFLTSLLDTIISRTRVNKIDSFSISNYIDTLKKISSYDLPPIPEPPPVNKTGIKFSSPGYKQ